MIFVLFGVFVSMFAFFGLVLCFLCYWCFVSLSFFVCLFVCLLSKRETQTKRRRGGDNIKLDMSRGLEDLGTIGRGEEYDQIMS